MTIAADIQKLEPGAIVELFELDATAVGGTLTRWHPGRNGLLSAIIWQGNTYDPFPLQASGFERNANGTLPRPTVRIANVNGTIGALIHQYNDLVGAKLTRRRTLGKYLDRQNFPGWAGYALRFDGDDSVSIADPGNGSLDFGTGDMSIECWIRPDTMTAAMAILAKGLSGTGPGYGLRMNNAGNQRVSFWVGDGTSVMESTAAATVPIGGWHHVVGVRRSNVIECWLDGVMATAGSLTGNTANGQPLIVGWRGGATFFVGAIDEARVYSRALSSGEIAAHYAGTFADNTGLSLYLNFEQTVTDSSGLNNNGTVSGNPAYVPRFDSNPLADPTAAFPDEVWFVDRKSAHTKLFVELELAAAWDVSGVKLPRRQVVANVCPWIYRGAECSYAGGAVAKADDTPTSDLAQDRCGKRIASCKLRFGANAELPYGGFPAAGLVR